MDEKRVIVEETSRDMTEDNSCLSILNKIFVNFNELDDLFNRLPDAERERIYEMHNECYSLPHCIRWGIQAIDEIINE